MGALRTGSGVRAPNGSSLGGRGKPRGALIIHSVFRRNRDRAAQVFGTAVTTGLLPGAALGFAGEVSAGAADGSGFQFHIADYVPVWATARAIREAYQACTR